jgi:hypothetical protein
MLITIICTSYLQKRFVLLKTKGNRGELYYLLDYITLYFVFLNKNVPASKKVGMDDNPRINNQSFPEIGSVWKMVRNGG